MTKLTKTQLEQKLEEAEKRIAELEVVNRNVESKNEKQVVGDMDVDFRTFIEQSHEGIAIFSEDGNVIFWNEAQTKITGIPIKDAIGMSYWEMQSQLLTPESRERAKLGNFESKMKKAFRDEKQASLNRPVELEIIALDGIRKSLLISSFPIRTKEGYRIGSVTQDISEQKHAEELLYTQRDLARMLSQTVNYMEAMPHCLQAALRIADMDSGGIYLFNIDTGALELVYHQGLKEEFVQVVSYYAADAPNLRLIRDGKMSYFSESDLVEQKFHRDEGLLSLAVIPIVDHGQVLGCINIGSHTLTQVPESSRKGIETVAAEIGNVIAHLYTERNLRDSQERVELALKGANTGMWDWNVQTGVSVYNERWAEMLGYSLDELAPVSFKTWAELCHPDDLKKSNELIEKHFSGELDVYECEARLKHKNGDWVWVLSRGRVVAWNGDGKPLRMIGTHLDITERKQYENALAANQQRLKSLIDSQTHFMVRINLAGRYTYCNSVFEKEFGWIHEPKGVLNSFSLDTIYSYHHERVINVVKQCFLNPDKVFTVEIDKPAKNGGVRTTLWEFICMLDGQGQPSEIQCMGIEITERKTAELALRASEEKYRVLIKSLDNVVASVDATGRFLYANDMAAEQMGRSTDELIGKTMYDLFPPKIADSQMESIQRVIQEDRSLVSEAISFVRGAPRWYRTSILPIHNETGDVTQVLINSADIHDLKNTQQELQELNRTLEERVRQRTAEVQDLYENAPAGYHSLDSNGNILMINQTELNWLGYTREEVIGVPILNFLSPASRVLFMETFPIFKKQGQLRDLELEFVRKDSTTLPILVNADAIYDQDGNYFTSRSTVFDNTNKRAAEEAMRGANLELERAMRMKDEFLASMSHELRTPLNGILGLSEALQLDVYGSLTDKQRSTLVHIENSGRHLLDLINDILDVSKIEAGKFELEMSPCSLGEICQSSIQLTKGMAAKKRQNVNFSMNPASILVHGDGRRLKQVFVNLLSNAVKFTPENGALGLEVSINRTDNIVYISVWDQGIGISPEGIKKLFKPFVQLDSSLSRQQTGTGLGLTLVQRLVEMHGGSVEVQSNPGQGSRFTVALPCLSTDTGLDSVEDLIQSKFNYALIIEDDTLDAGHLSRYCKSIGITPVVYSHGQGVMEYVNSIHPDVIFLDLRLPDTSGWDVLTELKNAPETKRIPIVITSVEEDKQRALKLNADGYLVKFFTVSDLKAVLGNIQRGKMAGKNSILVKEDIVATVMIVDDNEINIETVLDYLSSKNFNVVSAQSGTEFLSLVSTARPDLVLMDIQMPVLDGLETIRRLRAMEDARIALIPVIALTALAMPGDREQCIDAGADEYMTKPFRLTELKSLIEQMIEDRKRKNNQ